MHRAAVAAAKRQLAACLYQYNHHRISHFPPLSQSCSGSRSIVELMSETDDSEQGPIRHVSNSPCFKHPSDTFTFAQRLRRRKSLSGRVRYTSSLSVIRMPPRNHRAFEVGDLKLLETFSCYALLSFAMEAPTICVLRALILLSMFVDPFKLIALFQSAMVVKYRCFREVLDFTGCRAIWVIYASLTQRQGGVGPESISSPK